MNTTVTIENIIVENTSIYATSSYVAGIVGYSNSSKININNIKIEDNTTITGESGVGGIIGRHNSTTNGAIITSCVNKGKITATKYARRNNPAL